MSDIHMQGAPVITPESIPDHFKASLDMRRNMDLVREILLEAERLPAEGGYIELSKHDDDHVRYHLRIMVQANLLDVQFAAHEGTIHETVWIKGLTWPGHEFLDTARDNSKWKAATAKVAHAAGGMVFEVLRDLLMAQAKGLIGLGIEP